MDDSFVTKPIKEFLKRRLYDYRSAIQMSVMDNGYDLDIREDSIYSRPCSFCFVQFLGGSGVNNSWNALQQREELLPLEKR